jgi:hypothetical protein
MFVCGVVPMASLLLAVAVLQAPKLIRGGLLPPFVLGFEAVGWATIFGFITFYSMIPEYLSAFMELIATYITPVFGRYPVDTPDWLGLLIEFGAAAIIFSSPQLPVALLGGWLMHKLGLTLRFERRRTAMPARATQ